jgi:glutaredoxin
VKVRIAAPEPPRRPSAGGVWIAVTVVASLSLGMLALAFSRASSEDNAIGLRAGSGGPYIDRPAREEPLRAVEGPAPTRRDGDPAAIAAPPSVPPTLSDASRRVPIELYTAAWCSACASAHRWLDAHDVRYEEIDVDRRPGAVDQLAALNPRRTLPTFDIDGDVLVGFDPARLETAITAAAARHPD